LAQRARPAVPRIRVGRQARFLALGVDTGELGLRHEDLATDRGGRSLAQPARQGLDRAQVGGHVLAGGPVAAGRTLDEAASLVAQRDGQAVDLELGHVTEIRRGFGGRRQAQAAADALVESAQFVFIEDVAEREHGPLVDDLA
jgi:hypothetical protein